jgi:hypothetical protein
MTETAEQFDDRDETPKEQQEPEKKQGDPVLDIGAEAAAGGGPELGGLTDEEAEHPQP